MSDLKEKIEEAWWKIAADNKYGLKIMPTPKHHLNLVGDKQKFLDAAIEAVKAHIEGCKGPVNPHKCYCDKYSPHTMTKGQIARDAKYHGYEYAIEAYCKALMESLKTSD